MGCYSLHLVGESNYQGAVGQLRVGDPVKLTPEPGNRFDPRAIAAVSRRVGLIGYVERDSWITRAMLDEATPVASRVAEIIGGEPGKPMLGVVLEVLTAADATAALVKGAGAAETAAVPSKRRGKAGCWTWIGGGLFGVVALIIIGAPETPPSNPASGGTAIVAAPPAARPQRNSPAINAAEFAALRTGMSRAAATEIVGSPGELISESDIAGYRTIMVQWQGDGFGANANAMFQNDRLISKAQLGLK